MFLPSETAAKYPDFAYWLRYELARIPQKKPEIYEIFKKYAAPNSFFYDMPSLFLTWGFRPEIGVRPWGCEDDGEIRPKTPGSDILIQPRSIKRYGFTAPDGSIILIASDLARGVDDPTMGQVTEATVLHELIHWCRGQAGLDIFDEGPPYAFEKEAYGHVVVRTWEACFSQEMYIPKGQ